MTIHFDDVFGAKSPAGLQSESEYSSDYDVTAFGYYRAFGKRAFDILFVIASAPIGLVLIGIAALLTAMDGHNPFFRQ